MLATISAVTLAVNDVVNDVVTLWAIRIIVLLLINLLVDGFGITFGETGNIQPGPDLTGQSGHVVHNNMENSHKKQEFQNSIQDENVGVLVTDLPAELLVYRRERLHTHIHVFGC